MIQEPLRSVFMQPLSDAQKKECCQRMLEIIQKTAQGKGVELTAKDIIVELRAIDGIDMTTPFDEAMGHKRIEDWHMQFFFLLNEKKISKESFKEILNDAGQKYGIGAAPGFGRFKIN